MSLNKIDKKTEDEKSPITNSYVYRDFSQMSIEQVIKVVNPKKHIMEHNSNKAVGNSSSSFPLKLHKIIEQSEAEGYSPLISWQPHGRAFKIHNEQLFIERIATRFFFLTMISSFKRQLGVWGFQKMVGNKSEEDKDKGCYYHELFLRGREELCHYLVRSKKRSLVNRENQPNFYLMKPLPPTCPANGSLPQFLRSVKDEKCLAGIRKLQSIDGMKDLSMKSSDISPSSPTIIVGSELPNQSYLESTGNLLSAKPYFDFSVKTDEEVVGSIKGRLEVFPVKLHKIIERSEIDGYSHIVSWQEHGRSFKIHNETLFMQRIVHQFFFMQKIVSFRRQLGIWGFRKITGNNNPDKGSYYHSLGLFLRSRPRLCIAITRGSKRSLVEPENEPVFSDYPQMPVVSSDSFDFKLCQDHQLYSERRVHYQHQREKTDDYQITKKPRKDDTQENTLSVAAALVELSRV